MQRPGFVPFDLSYVVPCYFNQQDQDTLVLLLRRYATYRPELLDRILFVIVDDGSPLPVQIPADIDLNLRLLRIDEDIPWNQAGARNLGVVYARSDKVVATDVDHEFPEATLEYVLGLRPLGKKMYKPARLEADGTPISPHPNTFVMSRGRFLQFYGYDEEFTGAYCYEDGMFWRWQRYNGTRFFYMSKKHPIIRRAVDDKGSYHSLARDKTRNAAIRDRKKLEMAEYGPRGGHSRRFLEFTWKEVEQRRRRNPTWQAPRDRMWKKLFWLRWLRCV
jgi:glycosyltransferase involved in cell wall biosynthesis